MNNNAFIAILVSLVALLVAPYIGLSLANEDYTPIIVVAGLFLVITVAKHGVMAFSIMTATMGSALIIPGPGRPYWWEFAALLGFSGIGSGLVFGTMRRGWTENLAKHKWIIGFSILYACLLVVLMRVHGVGLNIFGSETAGGRFYLQQMILVSLPITAACFGGDRRLIVRLAIIQFLLSGTFLVSDYFYNYWNKLSPYVLQFFELSTDTLNFAAIWERGGMRRWQSLSRFGSGLMLLLMVMVPLRHFVSIRAVFLWPIAFFLLVMMTLGGHRSTVIEIGMVAAVVAVCQRLTSFKYVAGTILVAVLTIVTVYVAAPSLPPAGQRAVSFLPGIDIEYEAKHDADMTMKVRRDLRGRAAELIDQYFWDGRGFGVNADHLFNAQLRQDTVEYHVIIGRFYSGPLGIFVSCGVFGVIIFGLFLAASCVMCVRLIRMLRSSDADTRFHRVAGVFCGKFVWTTISFCVITGDAQSAMKTFLPLVSVMIACEVALRHERLRATESAKVRGRAGRIVRPKALPTGGGLAPAGR